MEANRTENITIFDRLPPLHATDCPVDDVPDGPVEGAIALVVLSVHVRTGVQQQTYYLNNEPRAFLF